MMKPLFVDLDGTLLFNDSVQETFFRLLLRKPWLGLRGIGVLCFQGRAKFKAYLAEHVDLKNIQWAINPAVVELIQKERIRGRKVILLTASHEKIARTIVEPLQIFDHIEGSTATRNFKGKEKLAWIREHYPDQSFLYAGNSMDDVVLWSHADEAIVVNPFWRVLGVINNLMGKSENKIRVVKNQSSLFFSFYKMLRLHQYSKNLLLFIPLLLSGKFLQWPLLLSTLLAWISFSATASVGYIVNDLVDLDHDRAHPGKKYRPFAAGQINFSHGFIAGMVLILIALFTAALLPKFFSVILIAYLMLTLAYSFFLKRLPIIDVFVLSILYLIRIVAGSIATSVNISYWLFVFALFFFLSLAYLKRFIEINDSPEDKIKGRGYNKEDLLLVKISGLTLGFLSTLIFTLYMNSNASLAIYKYPNGLWAITLFLLYWINYTWHAAVHGQVHDDPIKFALTDKLSLMLGVLIVLTIVICQGWLG